MINEKVDSLDFDKRWKEEFQIKSKIIDLINRIGAVSIKEYDPLKVTFQDDFVLFPYAIERIKYIIDYLENKNIDIINYASCTAFFCLFLGANDFKLNNIDRKIKYFEEIVNFLETRKESEIFNDLQQPDDLLILYENLFQEGFYANIALVIFNLEMDSIIEFTVKLIQKFYNVDIDFEFNQLRSLSALDALSDLYRIFVDEKGEGQNENYTHLKIENGHLAFSSFTNDEILKDINSINFEITEEKKTEKKIRKKKKKNKKKKTNILNNQENKTNIENNIIINNDNMDLKEESKDKNSIEDINKDNIIKNLNCKINELEKDKNELTKKNKKYLEIIRDKGNKIKKLNEEINLLSSKINKINSERNKIKENLDKYKKMNNDMTNEISKLKSDLVLIKIRDGLKQFINFIYKSCELSGETIYEEKISHINNYFDEKFRYIKNKSFLKKTKNILFNIYKKLKSGNELAHDVNLDMPIIEQIKSIIIIDKEKENEITIFDLIQELNSDQIIKELILNKKNYYNNYVLMLEKEARILSNVQKIDQKIEQNFFQNQK
jgi:hypothetical protein